MLKSQEEAITRKVKKEDTGDEDDKEALDDIGYIMRTCISLIK